MHSRHVLVGTVKDSLGLSLTELHSTADGLVEVSAHTLNLGLEVATVGSGLGLPVVSDTGDVLEALLVLLIVGGHSVHQGVETGGELGLGALHGGGGGHLGHAERLGELLVFVELLGLLGRHALVHLLGGRGQVLRGLAAELSHEGTQLLELGIGRLAEVLNLLGSDDFVFVEELFQLATGTLGGGEAAVREADHTVHLSLGALVDTDLGSLVGDNHGRHDSDLTGEARLLVLHGGGEAVDVHGELLAGSSGLLPGELLTPGDVLDGLAETSILERGALGEGIVEASDGTREGAVLSGTVLTHLSVSLTELLVGVLAGTLERAGDELEGSGVTGSGRLVGTLKLTHVGGASGVDLLLEGIDVGLHLRGNLTSVLLDSTAVRVHTSVGLLDLLGGLLLEGEKGASLSTDGIAESASGLLLVGGNLGGEGSTGSGVLLVGGSETLVETEETLVGPGDNLLQVALGEGSGGAHGVEDLATHLSAGALGRELEVLNVGVDALGEGTNLGGDTGGERITGLLVHLLGHLLDLLGALLTLVHGLTDRGLELELVRLGLHLEHAAALGGLDCLSLLNLGQLLDLGGNLLVVLHHGGVKGAEAVGKAVLGLAESLVGVETGTTGSLSELLVGSSLSLGVLGEHSEELAGGLGETTLLVVTVLLGLGTDLGDLEVEVLGHHLHTLLDLSLVLADDAVEGSVLLGEDLLTVVTHLDHTLHLSADVLVDAGLLETVLGDDTLELSHTTVQLADLVLHGGTEVEQVHLELLLRGSYTGKLVTAGLGLSCNLVHVLVEPVHRVLEVLAGLTRVDLDLGGVSGDVLVGLPNLGVGRRVEG